MSITNNPISFYYTDSGEKLFINSTFIGEIYVNGELYQQAFEKETSTDDPDKSIDESSINEDEYTPSEVQSESEQEIIRLYTGGVPVKTFLKMEAKETELNDAITEELNDTPLPLLSEDECYPEGSIEDFSIFLREMKTTHTINIVEVSLDKSKIVLLCRFTPVYTLGNVLTGHVYKLIISSKENELCVDRIKGKINSIPVEEYSFPTNDLSTESK